MIGGHGKWTGGAGWQRCALGVSSNARVPLRPRRSARDDGVSVRRRARGSRSLLGEPAIHKTTRCPGSIECVPGEKTCERCDRCPTGALLLESANSDASYVLTKMAAVIPDTTTTNVTLGCGNGMPSFLASGILSLRGSRQGVPREVLPTHREPNPEPRALPVRPQRARRRGGRHDGCSRE